MAALTGRAIAFAAAIMQLITLDTVDSTNEEAKRRFWANPTQAVPLCVVARQQTAGKGTQGRVWVSPPDAGLYLSYLHPLTEQQAACPLTTDFTLAAGVACVRAIQAVTGVTVQLKPINDLVVGRAKLGGILVESLIQQGRMRALITGVGLNIRDVPRALPPECLAAHQSRGPVAAGSPEPVAGPEPITRGTGGFGTYALARQGL